jgi:hypothetical protein
MRKIAIKKQETISKENMNKSVSIANKETSEFLNSGPTQNC